MNESCEKYNIGISVLKIWMSFEVVLDHYADWKSLQGPHCLNNILYSYGQLAVPIFMLLAFLLSDVYSLANDTKKIRSRFYRLCVPQIFWTLLYYFVYKITDRIYGTGLLHGKSDIFWQLIFGHSYNRSAWFQFAIICITMLFILIFRLKNEKTALICTIFIGVVALLLEYTGINARVIGSITSSTSLLGAYFDRSYVTYPLGRLCEMIPYAVIGILIYKFRILQKLQEYSKYIILGSISLLCVLLSVQDMLPSPAGYGYQGLVFVVISTLSVMIFYYLPLDGLSIRKQDIIISLSKHTMAIYFMHNLVATLLYNSSISKVLGMHAGSIYDCIVIYILCLAVAAALGRIPCKWIKVSMG